MGVFAVDFRGRVRKSWGLRGGLLVSNRASFEGRRDAPEGQGAGVVQIGVDRGGNVGKGGPIDCPRPSTPSIGGLPRYSIIGLTGICYETNSAELSFSAFILH